MRAKPTIDGKEVVDKWDGILDSIPFAAEPGAGPSEKYDIFAMINGYEKEAREILKAGGYPLTVKELLNKPQKDRRIRDIMRMLTYFREVRIYISMNDAAGAALSMAYGVRSAMQARIRPVEPLIEIGKKVVGGGKHGGARSGEVRREKTTPTKEAWQAESEKIWRKRPAWSKRQIATEIEKRIGGNPDTIRKSIQKPLP